MSALELYLKSISESRGLHRQRRLWNLRSYLKRETTERLATYIARIDRIDYLKILWEAGLTADLQKAVTRRTLELTRKRVKE